VKKFAHIIITLSFFCFGFLSCDKDPFTHIEFHGRVVNYMTKAPLQASINLSTGEPPDNKGNTVFGSYTTNADGSFDIKSEGGWNSTTYWLVISEKSGYIQQSYQVKHGQNADVGDVLMGSYTFYCKVTLNPTDNSAIDFVVGGPSTTSHFNAGTATQFLASATYTFDEYFGPMGNGFTIVYKTYPGGVEKETVISVPAPNTDTLSVTINY